MSKLLKIFNNIRILRAQTRECALEVLEEILEKLKIVINERREKDRQIKVELRERARKLQQYREMLMADGIDPDELLKPANLGVRSSSRGKKVIRPAKYRYTSDNGDVKTWTGQGRIPAVIKRAIDEGRALEDFLL